MESNPIKVKHAVYPTQEAIDNLFKLASDPSLITYSTVEEQTAALNSAKIDFETLLNMYLHKAFKKGKKLGKAYCEDLKQ